MEEAGTARMSMEQTMDAPTGTFSSEAEGVVDFAGQRGQMTMTLSGLPGQDGATIEAVADDFIIYMKSPLLDPVLKGPESWVSIDLQAAGEEMGIDMKALAGQSDPSQMLDYLQGTTDVEEIGTEEVRNVDTTHYRFKLDFEELAETGPEEIRESVKVMVEDFGFRALPGEIWLDEQGLVRRLFYEFEYRLPDAAEDGTFGPLKQEMTIDYYDFGVPVNIEVPPKDDVIDLQELMEGASP